MSKWHADGCQSLLLQSRFTSYGPASPRCQMLLSSCWKRVNVREDTSSTQEEGVRKKNDESQPKVSRLSSEIDLVARSHKFSLDREFEIH
eukprot:g59684.t1